MGDDNCIVSIVIPTKDRRGTLERCLASIARQRYANFEVIVVDGGSTDGTTAMLERNERKLNIRLISRPGGLVDKVNEGFKHCKGRIFVRIDDDVVADPYWLEAIVSTFGMSNKIGGVTGPTIVPPERTNSRDLLQFQHKFLAGGLLWRMVGVVYYSYFLEGQPFAIGKWFRSGAFSLGSNYERFTRFAQPVEVDHHEACNMAVRIDILRRIGGFDPIYTGLGEFHEADVSFKIRRLGYKILFHPKAKVHHLLSRGGYFQDRPGSYGRVVNFVNFYFKNVRADNPDKLTRLLSYLLFLNSYWVYTFLSTGQVSQLGGLHGTLTSLRRNSLPNSKFTRR